MMKLSFCFSVLAFLFEIALSRSELLYPICHVCPGGNYGMDCPECLIDIGVKQYTCAEARDYGIKQQVSRSTCKMLQQEANNNINGCGCNTPVDVSVGKAYPVCEICPHLNLGMPVENLNAIVRISSFNKACKELDSFGGEQLLSPGTCEEFRSDGEACCEQSPTQSPEPTNIPTVVPTKSPTLQPTDTPTYKPTIRPTTQPTSSPSNDPTLSPTFHPTKSPIRSPTNSPTLKPTLQPTLQPTEPPTHAPTISPTLKPTKSSSSQPSARSSLQEEVQDPTSETERIPILKVTKNEAMISCNDTYLLNSSEPTIIHYHYDLFFDPSSITIKTAIAFVESTLSDSVAFRYGILPDGASCTNQSKPSGLPLWIVRVESLPQGESTNVFALAGTPCSKKTNMPAGHRCHTVHGRMSISFLSQDNVTPIVDFIKNQLDGNQFKAGTFLATTWREMAVDESVQQQQQGKSSENKAIRTTIWVVGVFVLLFAMFAPAMVIFAKRRKVENEFLSNPCIDKDDASCEVWEAAFIPESWTDFDDDNFEAVETLDDDDDDSVHSAWRTYMGIESDGETDSTSESDFCTAIIDTTIVMQTGGPTEIIGLYGDSDIITVTDLVNSQDDRRSGCGRGNENNAGLEIQLEDISSGEWIR